MVERERERERVSNTEALMGFAVSKMWTLGKRRKWWFVRVTVWDGN